MYISIFEINGCASVLILSLFALAERIRSEYVLRVKGAVRHWRSLRSKPKLELMLPKEPEGLENFFQ